MKLSDYKRLLDSQGQNTELLAQLESAGAAYYDKIGVNYLALTVEQLHDSFVVFGYKPTTTGAPTIFQSISIFNLVDDMSQDCLSCKRNK